MNPRPMNQKAMNQKRGIERRSNRFRGITMVECVVAASILIVAMGTVTTMSFRLNRVWIDVAHQRIAMNELTNTLESLCELPVDEIEQAIAELSPSTAANASLYEPELTGERINDSFGDRVALRLTWKSAHPIRPAELVGWIDSQGEEP